MSAKATDLRIVKTRKALADALFELLNKKSFDEIKVVDICEAAMVHRTTFYKHFEDKYHLLTYVINDIINELTESISSDMQYGTPEEFYTALLHALVEYVHKNETKFKLIAKNNASGMFVHTMQGIMSAHILEFLRDFSKRGYSFEVPLPLIAQYRSGGMIFVAYYLLENNNPYDVDELYNYMYRLFYEPPYQK